MSDILQGSMLVRILQAIGKWFYSIFCGSAAVGACRRTWQQSKTRSILCSILYAPDSAVQSSRTRSLFARINSRLCRMQRLKAYLRASVLYRIYSAVFRWARESKLCRWLLRGGTSWLILLFVGLYVLIDYLLRDVLAIAAISSVWDEGLLVFALCWIVWQRIRCTDPMRPAVNALDLPIFLFLSVGFVLMCIISPYSSIQFAGYRATMQYLLWFYVITRLLQNEQDFTFLYLTLVSLATAIALHGIYQYIVGVPMPASWVAQAETAVRTRVYSIFGSPNIMGDYMVMFVPMAAGLAYYVKDTRLKLLCWLCTFIMCFACLFTMSRGAWVAMAITIVLFVLLVDKRLFLLLLAGGVLLVFIPFVRTRIGFLFTDEFVQANTNGGRGGRWEIGMELLYGSNPLLGLGLGMFGGAVAMQNQVLDGVQYFYLDNYYLKILVEMGYVGLVSFLVMIFGMLLCSLRSIFRMRGHGGTHTDRFYPLACGMFSGLCGVLVHCYFENIFEEPYMMVYFWVIAAMIVYLGFLRKTGFEKG